MKKKTEEMSSQQKYMVTISSIQMLSYRANEKETRNKLGRIAQYLKEVRSQMHLCMASEQNRIEMLRYKELLEYIDKTYDGSDKSLVEICKALGKRKDINEVLRYYDNRKKRSQGQER